MPSDAVANGSITANAQSLTLDTTGRASAVLALSGTWVGSIAFEYTPDGGTNWYALPAYPVGAIAAAAVTSATANGIWRADVGAYPSIRARASAWTSGTATVRLEASAAEARPGGIVTVLRGKATPTESAVSGSGSGTLVAAGARQSVRATVVSGSAWVSRATPAATAAPSRLMYPGDYLYDDETTAAWYYTAVGGTATFSVEVVA